MAGQQAAAAEPVLDVVRLRGDSLNELMPGQRPPESCQPPPEPPSHSPRIARAATMRPLGFLHRTGQRPDLARGAHAGPDERAEQVGGHGEP